MKTNGNDPAQPLDHEIAQRAEGGYGYPEQFSGLTKRELMAIEFTKTLLGLRHYDNQPVYELTKYVFNPDDEMSRWNNQYEADAERRKEVDLMTEKALYVTDALIEALNKQEEQS
jgi:hypothetical protein